IPKSTYYDQHNRQSAALIRARQPYLVRNIVTGAAIFGFAIGVYAFTIRAVAQDDFEDVPMPPAPAQPAHAPNASAVTSLGRTSQAQS
ncbi:hypothetical protein LTS18_011425, partial [Coniosporium uncinatum]